MFGEFHDFPAGEHGSSLQPLDAKSRSILAFLPVHFSSLCSPLTCPVGTCGPAHITCRTWAPRTMRQLHLSKPVLSKPDYHQVTMSFATAHAWCSLTGSRPLPINSELHRHVCCALTSPYILAQAFNLKYLQHL